MGRHMHIWNDFGLILAYIWTVNKRDKHAKGGVNGTAKWIKDSDLPNKWENIILIQKIHLIMMETEI